MYERSDGIVWVRQTSVYEVAYARESDGDIDFLFFPSAEHHYAAVNACVLTATTAMWVANINKERDGERSAPLVVPDLFVLFRELEPINCRALLEPLSCRSGKLMVQVT